MPTPERLRGGNARFSPPLAAIVAKYAFFTNWLMRDRLLVGLYDDDMRVKILEAWDDKTNMSLADP